MDKSRNVGPCLTCMLWVGDNSLSERHHNGAASDYPAQKTGKIGEGRDLFVALQTDAGLNIDIVAVTTTKLTRILQHLASRAMSG